MYGVHICSTVVQVNKGKRVCGLSARGKVSSRKKRIAITYKQKL